MAMNQKKADEVTKRLRGRPSKYKKKYCKDVIELGKKGYLTATMAAEFGVAKSTLKYWVATEEDFSDAFGIARACCESFYEKQLATVESSTDLNKCKWVAGAYFHIAEAKNPDIIQNISQETGIKATVSFGDRDEPED